VKRELKEVKREAMADTRSSVDATVDRVSFSFRLHNTSLSDPFNSSGLCAGCWEYLYSGFTCLRC
jgi:hypothetical protein